MLTVKPKSSIGAVDKRAAGRPQATRVHDRVMQATIVCVGRRGFDRTSIEDIASEANVSRTTLYRKFGNKQELFRAFLIHEARNATERTTKIVGGPGSVAQRLEEVIVTTVLEMTAVSWLKPQLNEGLSRSSIALFRSVARIVDDVLRPLLSSLLEPDGTFAGIAMDDVSDWLMEQMIELASANATDEAVLRRRVRVFILRVLVPAEPATASSVKAVPLRRIEAIERRLDRLAEHLGDKKNFPGKRH